MSGCANRGCPMKPYSVTSANDNCEGAKAEELADTAWNTRWESNPVPTPDLETVGIRAKEKAITASLEKRFGKKGLASIIEGQMP